MTTEKERLGVDAVEFEVIRKIRVKLPRAIVSELDKRDDASLGEVVLIAAGAVEVGDASGFISDDRYGPFEDLPEDFTCEFEGEEIDHDFDQVSDFLHEHFLERDGSAVTAEEFDPTFEHSHVNGHQPHEHDAQGNMIGVECEACGKRASLPEHHEEGCPLAQHDDPAYIAYLRREEARGEMAFQPETMGCFECIDFDSKRVPPERKVVKLGPTVEERRDPTQSYVLECGHTVI